MEPNQQPVELTPVVLPSADSALTEEEWVKSVVGRDVEIFWKPSQEAATEEAAVLPVTGTLHDNTTPSKPQAPQGVIVTEIPIKDVVMLDSEKLLVPVESKGAEKDCCEDEADWYQGRIVGVERSGRHCMLQVIFVGDETVYEMPLQHVDVRPCVPVADPALTQEEWTESVVGRNWEIFWKPDASTTTDEALSVNEDKVEDEADWYQGSIVGVERSGGHCVFQVLFVGDETVYEMPLHSAVVRPCTPADSTATQEEWIESVMGRDWEIFWKPEGEAAPVSKPPNDNVNLSEPQAPQEVIVPETPVKDAVMQDSVDPVIEDSSGADEDTLEHEADWYAARLVSVEKSGGKYAFQVLFVGEETVYNMPLQPACVRPSAPHDPVVTDEWIDSVIGRDWEIFWKPDEPNEALSVNEALPDSSSPSGPHVPQGVIVPETPDQDVIIRDVTVPVPAESKRAPKNADEHEAAWYAARLVGVERSGSHCFFQIRFVGDETVYCMSLQSANLRPCAQTWIRRTLALLDPPVQTPQSSWEASLPPDTSLLRDAERLGEIKRAIETDRYPPLAEVSNVQSLTATVPSVSELDQVRRLGVLIESQVYLRSLLAPVTGEDVGSGYDPTEAYLNYLVECLSKLQLACFWYYRCYELHARILGPALPHGTSRPPLSPDLLFHDLLSGGRQVVMMLISMDASVVGSKRKRRAPQPTSPSGSRRTKRRRKNKGFSDFWHEELDGKVFNEDVDDEDFRSTHIVKRLVERLRSSDARWHSQYFGTMLRSLSGNFVAPLEKWNRRVGYYLGDRTTLDIETSDGETSGEESDGDSEAELVQSAESMIRVTYEEIESTVNSGLHDRVIKHFDNGGSVVRLQEKLVGIVAFEEKAWGVIGAVLDDIGESWATETDETTEALNLLIQSTQGASVVSNVSPLGLGTSSLTRQVLKNAIVYRTWFLDLKYAESVRERVAFVDDVVSRVSKLPPLPSKEGSLSTEGTGISAKLDTVSRRVRDLSAKHIDHVALFNRYKALLNDRVVSNGMRTGLLVTEGVTRALEELRQTTVVSVAEEMLTLRLDLLRWEAQARETLSQPKPSYDDLSSLKLELDAISEARSGTRWERVGTLKPNAGVDEEVRIFVRLEMDTMCDSLCKRTRTLYTTSRVWKERADAILTTLRIFDNPDAGPTVTAQRLPAMIDLKRVDDLLNEYNNLEVDLADQVLYLTNVSVASRKWATKVTEGLSDESSSFEACLSLVEDLGRFRPKGVIVEPTRQTIEMLHVLIGWYTIVKTLIGSPTHSHFAEDINCLPVEGIEILAAFSANRHPHGQFVVLPEQAQELLMKKTMSRKPTRALSVAKLQSNPLCNGVLTRMIGDKRDEKEGFPMLSLLHMVWKAFVEDFLRQSEVPSSRAIFTLEAATKLRSQKPSMGSSILWQTDPHVERLATLIESGNETEAEAKRTLSQSKGLLRESKHRMEDVRLHLPKVKDLYVDFKARVGIGCGLILSSVLENQLDRDIKIFGWLVRTFQYPVLQTNEDAAAAPPEKTSEDATDTRIPWDVLVGLYDRIPSSDHQLGDFACAVLRVRELYEAANAWQEEISSLTMLSLRGGRRRNQSGTSPVKSAASSNETDDGAGSSKIDVEKVNQLSYHPILLKVAMPREGAVRNMLGNTQTFEIELLEFLGKDYDGADLDRSPYPEPGSLVGEDGAFLLYRLTCSPLFRSLKSRIASIGKIADNVFADTPGKATFDWICKAVDWIEAIHSAVSRDDSQYGSLSDSRLVLPAEDARKLLAKGETILLDVPEDLRRTLSQHRIFVSSTKDGTMIVKSTKGGAHHAVGVTVIRWCPFLFESLKSDVSKLDEWQRAICKQSEKFVAFSTETKGVPLDDPLVLHRYHEFRHDIANLLIQSSDLVACPTRATQDATRTLLGHLDARIEKHSNAAMAKKFAETRYSDGLAVIRDRYRLLDALMDRSSLASTTDTQLEGLDARDGTFRNVSRVILEKVLRKAAEAMEVGSDMEALFSFCAMRSWDIENALFDLFQDELGESQVSPEYREKARALKRSLEDTSNLAFCARVLSGDIGASKLVRMTTHQLANPKTREDRARAEATARQNAVLTRGGPTGEQKPNAAPQASNVSSVEPEPPNLDQKPAAEPRKDKPVLQSSMKDSSKAKAKLQDLVNAASKSGRPTLPPPPPPSLAASLHTAVQTSGSSTQERTVSNSSGGDQFRFSLANATRKFVASLSVDSDQQSDLDGLLPETITEKGRLKIKEFTSFLSGKVGGGKWEAFPLRFVTSSDQDTRQLKKFAKDYEARDRIAMVSLESHADELSKLFIVPPKYHSAARGVRFGAPKATYAVLLKLSRS